MRRGLLAAVVAAGVGVLSPAAAVSGSSPVINPWAGEWQTNTGHLALRVVTAAAGVADLTAQNGEPCWQPTTYYTGGYDDAGGLTGRVTGCTEGQTNFVGRYLGDPNTDEDGIGSIDINIVSRGHFDGTYTQDGSSPATYSGDLTGHASNDGCCGALVVNFTVSASGVPNIPISGPDTLTSATLSGSGHATFTAFAPGSTTVLTATETKGQLVFDATTASGKTKHFTFGIISGTLYAPSTRRLGLLLRVTSSNDPACPDGLTAATLTLLPSYQSVRDEAILAGAPYAQTIGPGLGGLFDLTSTPCKGLGYGWERDTGVHVTARLSESTPGAST